MKNARVDFVTAIQTSTFYRWRAATVWRDI
jgi:hypothetical protein